MLPADDPVKGIGLRMIFGLEEKQDAVKVDYVNIMNLNYLVITVRDFQDPEA